jgi:plastocyanin
VRRGPSKSLSICLSIGRSICLLTGVLVAAFTPASSLAASQTVNATPSLQFSPNSVVIDQGDTVTWNNTGGLHNVHFDDNSFIMPASPSTAAWSVSRTFSAPGMFRYYCQVHGGPNGSGMSGVVWVNGPGYARPKGASPLRASLAPAYKPCSAGSANRTHGSPLAHPSCSPPVQVSDFLTVGTPDANGTGANSVGSIVTKVLVAGDVRFISSLTDVRKKSDLSDYTGELQAKLSLRITDKTNGPSLTEPATGDTTFAFAIPCTATGLATIGSSCSITTSANAIAPGAVVNNARAIWELGGVQVFDGGADGVASTAGNTLFADQAILVP